MYISRQGEDEGIKKIIAIPSEEIVQLRNNFKITFKSWDKVLALYIKLYWLRIKLPLQKT